MGSKLKAILIDLSGTLHIENSAISGAQDALNRCLSIVFKTFFPTLQKYDVKIVSFNTLDYNSIKFKIIS